MTSVQYEDHEEGIDGGFCPVCRNSRCYAGGNHTFEPHPIATSGWKIEEKEKEDE